MGSMKGWFQPPRSSQYCPYVGMRPATGPWTPLCAPHRSMSFEIFQVPPMTGMVA